MIATKPCPYCGVIFKPSWSGAKYCSRQCFADDQRRSETRICETCGMDFACQPASKKRFCSNDCKRTRDPNKRGTFTCNVCGIQFEGWTYRQNKVCSRKCASSLAKGVPHLSARKPENFVTIFCEQCSKEYVIHKFFVTVRSSRFCSTECKYKWSSENIVGVSHRSYRGGTKFPNRGSNWSGQRKLALKRDGRTCKICGRKPRKGEKRVVDVHHITPYKEFGGDYLTANALANLITLCRQCHTKVELHGYSCPQPLL